VSTVAKWLQQVVASAIKHTASEVYFDLSCAQTKLTFKLADGRSSRLQLPIPPVELARLIVEKVKLFPVTAPAAVRNGLLRTEFSSMVSDCEVSLECSSGKLTRVTLSNFLIDAPDRASFWLGFEDRVAAELKVLLEPGRGVLFVWGEDNRSRTEAINALRSAFPQAETVPVLETISDELSLIDRAAQRLVIAGVGGKDPLAVLRQLLMFRPERKTQVLGVVFQTELPRNCISCRGERGEVAEPQLKEQFGSTLKAWRNSGCDLCQERGELGRFNISSLIAFKDEVRQLFLNDAPWIEIVDQLRIEGFYHPFEYALRDLGTGEVSEANLLKCSPRPPETYKLRIPKVEVEEVAQPQAVTETGRFVISQDFFLAKEPSEAPIRGVEVLQPKISETKVESEPVKRVLVIDDDPDQRAILGKVFQLAGFSVSSAADGIDGIVAASNDHPQIIIVDLMMPNMDGRETIRRLRENSTTKSVPIVALTAYPDPEVEYDLLDAGADDFCPKSVSKKVLLKRVERLMR
jgi:CheY-like chemotaxis protein